MRETLYEALPLAERVQLHAQVGRALLTSSAAEPSSHLAALSYHFFQAAPGGKSGGIAVGHPAIPEVGLEGTATSRRGIRPAR